MILLKRQVAILCRTAYWLDQIATRRLESQRLAAPGKTLLLSDEAGDLFVRRSGGGFDEPVASSRVCWRRAHGIMPRRPEQKPWLAEGMSRSTWYRRRKQAREVPDARGAKAQSGAWRRPRHSVAGSKSSRIPRAMLQALATYLPLASSVFPPLQ
jgi:hypothetical protein